MDDNTHSFLNGKGYCADDDHERELFREEIFGGNDFSAYIRTPLYSTYLLKILNIT